MAAEGSAEKVVCVLTERTEGLVHVLVVALPARTKAKRIGRTSDGCQSVEMAEAPPHRLTCLVKLDVNCGKT